MKTARLTVEIQMSPEGDLKCAHRPATEADRRELESWPSGGLVHMSHALLVETLRRESYTMALSLLSTGTKPEDLTADEIEKLTRAHLIEMTDQFASLAAREALGTIQSATSSPEATSNP
jgi:hypothetical protein